jgi:glycine/D-amino acid oxidase-like deaminating enzyme
MLTKRERRQTDACDVVVVGAGLVGAAAAARLTREGFDTAVLEARQVAGGATGRSVGAVFPGLRGHYSEAVSTYGREQAREIWSLSLEGRDRLIEAAERLDIPFQRTGGLSLAVDDEEADALWESAKLLRADGFDASFSLTDPLGRGFEAALSRPADLTVDAAALTRALLNEDDVMVHERTEVYALEPNPEGIRVWAHGRTVICSAVILAVNGYAALVDPYLAEHVAPVTYLVFVGDPLADRSVDRPCTVNGGELSLRTLRDGRLLLSVRRPEDALSARDPLPSSLLDRVSRHFPELDLATADRWSEVAGFTPDGLPLLGALPSVPEAYFAVGFGGRGLTWAFAAADRLVGAILHDAELGFLSSERLNEVRVSA